MFYWTYCSDTFDENTPPDDDPEYISSLGVAIFRGMQSGDNDGVWLMQVKEMISLSLAEYIFYGKMVSYNGSPIKCSYALDFHFVLMSIPLTLQGWLFSYDPFWRPPQMKVIFIIIFFHCVAFLLSMIQFSNTTHLITQMVLNYVKL